MQARVGDPDDDGGDMQEFTVEDLAKYDGRDGTVYVAYEGTVYDVSGSPMWTGGEHMDHTAGKDLTAEHADAPHDVLVTDFPAVGTLV